MVQSIGIDSVGGSPRKGEPLVEVYDGTQDFKIVLNRVTDGIKTTIMTATGTPVREFTLPGKQETLQRLHELGYRLTLRNI